MQLNLPIDRRRRATVLGLASLAGVVFVLFITRVFLLGPPQAPLRTCGLSEIYFDTSQNPPRPLSFTRAQQKYHFVMETLIEERMNLYEGTTLLACNQETMESVIPGGIFAQKVAETLRQTSFKPSPPADYFSPFRYDDFELLLTEFWRTYDCYLLALQTEPGVVGAAVPQAEPEQERADLYSAIPYVRKDVVEKERLRTRRTLDRLLFLIRSSEQYLPLHASLRCLQRGGTDIRNALALIADANQCIEKLAQPDTALLQ